ncbi:Actin cytoskeleton-regulatory complex protein sla1/complex protein sla1 [Blumeria hordei DH14]|uniref:Actin cytoskeleton-regulatory complex protein SLA1 n=1 Tax=Blumeria graminis f. sp. hordei (strain DH14) TaxID=546991 RepID=N1JJM7_BLUG1|nr:Actin cytoskeleton-regulatory complex protein sla1/complex protein sla1 [Blumeria hordei DH14]
MGFVGVYKALYDYAPQSEGELPISDGDILYILEKSEEDDWWKAKKKASGEDEDEPVGLIPNNYVEKVSSFLRCLATPVTHARALYDYTRQTDEEISFLEDSILDVYDISDHDWILVGLEEDFGFAPANYIEIEEIEDKTLQRSTIDSTNKSRSLEDKPRNVTSSATERSSKTAVAGSINDQKTTTKTVQTQHTPEVSEDDEPLTPSLPIRSPSSSTPASNNVQDISRSPSLIRDSEISSPNNQTCQKNTKGEPPYYAPGGFHMYNINEMISVMGKRKKMPTTLGINSAIGVILIVPEKSRDGPEQRWTAEKMTHYSIEGKHVFLELVRPSKSIDFHAGAKDTAQEIVAALGDLAGAVRAEGLREVIMAGAGQTQKKGHVLYDFLAQGADEVTVATGDEVIIIDDSKSEEWWQIRRLKTGNEGVVPSSYIEITGVVTQPNTPTVNVVRSTVEQNRLEEERLAKDSIRAVKELRSTEVGPGVRLPERGSSLSAKESSNSHGMQRQKYERPDPDRVRTWNDRSRSFSVEAQFLALKDGKINLHKMNGVKIAVPVSKMSIEDLEYVERQTGLSLDDEKPLSGLKKSRSRAALGPRDPITVTANRDDSAKILQYDWFQFFLACEVPVQLCERYSQAFQRDSMDESVLPDIDATVLRTLGIREGDIIKIMRFLDKKYSRSAKRGVSFGSEEVQISDGEPHGGLFSGPGGTLKNNTRKGRPIPATQTNNKVDPSAFSQDSRIELITEAEAAKSSSATVLTKDSGFEDDAWNIKPPTAQKPISSSSSGVQAQSVPTMSKITDSMSNLSLLSAPLEPIKLSNQVATGLDYSNQLVAPAIQFQAQNQSSLMHSTPDRPLSAPNVNLQSHFPHSPLQPQATGMQTSAGYQPTNTSQFQNQNSTRIQQGCVGLNTQPTLGSLSMMASPTNYSQLNSSPQNNIQLFQMHGSMQQPFNKRDGASRFAGPNQQFLSASPQQAGFQSPFPHQLLPQTTGMNSFLPSTLQHQNSSTSISIQQPSGFIPSFSPHLTPQFSQNAITPLVPQKTGPPPPVRFGVTGDLKKLTPQPTGRRANLSQASKSTSEDSLHMSH